MIPHIQEVCKEIAHVFDTKQSIDYDQKAICLQCGSIFQDEKCTCSEIEFILASDFLKSRNNSTVFRLAQSKQISIIDLFISLL